MRNLLIVTMVLAACASTDKADEAVVADSATVTNQEELAQPNAQMQAVLDALASLNPKPIESLTPVEARKQPTPADAVMQILVARNADTDAAALVPGVTARTINVKGAAGMLPATVYTPEGAGPFPVVLYFHGGGWVIANRMVYDGGARGLAKAANAVVVSVDYRLAPEHRFPAQHDDAIAAYRWLIHNAASIKGDPKMLALAGESAGGNLAIATAIAARDAGLQQPVHILSVYPIAQTDTTTAAYNENANAKPLNRPMMNWFVKNVVTSPANLKDWRIDLVHANLAGLPPVTIINAQIDPLRTDGEMLEQALRRANVSVERKTYGSVTHEFFGMAAVLDGAKQAQTYAGDRLKSSTRSQ